MTVFKYTSMSLADINITAHLGCKEFYAPPPKCPVLHVRCDDMVKRAISGMAQNSSYPNCATARVRPGPGTVPRSILRIRQRAISQIPGLAEDLGLSWAQLVADHWHHAQGSHWSGQMPHV